MKRYENSKHLFNSLSHAMKNTANQDLYSVKAVACEQAPDSTEKSLGEELKRGSTADKLGRGNDTLSTD